MSENILKLMLERADFAGILDENRKKKEFIDVRLQIGDQLFDAHRMILAAYSPVLKAMLSDQWSTSKICPISAEYVDPSIVEELLSFLYTGNILLTPDNVYSICVAAHFLQIASLLEPSVQHLCRLISVENVLTLFEFSLTCELEQLRDSCIQFIAKNNSEILQDANILKFSTSYFKDLIAGLKEQHRPENKLKENTFDCIVRWTEMNLSERSNELPVLLESIPLEELPQDFLTDVVSTHPLVEGSVSGSQKVSVALENYHKFELSLGSRKIQNLIAFCIDGSNYRISSIRCLDWHTESWRELPDLLEPMRYGYDCTIYNKRNIVVSGGNNQYGNFLNSVDIFDWATQTWEKLADFPGSFLRNEYSLVTTLNGHLYAACGGIKEKFPEYERATLYSYTFETQQWKPLSSLNIPRERFQLVTYGNHLYAFGGRTDIVEKYDPLLDQWSVMEQRSCDRNLYRSTVHLGKIYARGENRNLVMFDPETGDWSTISSSSGKRDLVSMNRRLLILDAEENILEFDFSTRQWKGFYELDTKYIHSRIIADKFY